MCSAVVLVVMLVDLWWFFSFSCFKELWWFLYKKNEREIINKLYIYRKNIYLIEVVKE